MERERGRGRGVRLITSLQANLYFELIFALPTWREGKKGEIQLRRRDWETEFGELTSAGRMLGKWNQTFWKLIKAMTLVTKIPHFSSL